MNRERLALKHWLHCVVKWQTDTTWIQSWESAWRRHNKQSVWDVNTDTLYCDGKRNENSRLKSNDTKLLEEETLHSDMKLRGTVFTPITVSHNTGSLAEALTDWLWNHYTKRFKIKKYAMTKHQIYTVKLPIYLFVYLFFKIISLTMWRGDKITALVSEKETGIKCGAINTKEFRFDRWAVKKTVQKVFVQDTELDCWYSITSSYKAPAWRRFSRWNNEELPLRNMGLVCFCFCTKLSWQSFLLVPKRTKQNSI